MTDKAQQLVLLAIASWNPGTEMTAAAKELGEYLTEEGHTVSVYTEFASWCAERINAKLGRTSMEQPIDVTKIRLVWETLAPEAACMAAAKLVGAYLQTALTSASETWNMALEHRLRQRVEPMINALLDLAAALRDETAVVEYQGA